jgi:hypothetical protein
MLSVLITHKGYNHLLILYAECLEGWLWMHIFIISISDLVCALWYWPCI